LADAAEAVEDWKHEARRHPFFEAFDAEQWNLMASRAQTAELSAKTPIFFQGEDARRFYWIGSGLVQLSRTSSSGQEQVLELIRPQQLFAEALMFTEAPATYPVDAVTVRASKVVAFDNDVARSLVTESSTLALRMLAQMAKRMHRLVATIDDLTLSSAAERVAQHLLIESRGRAAFALEVPKRTLAARLALTPESLSRILDREGLGVLAAGQ